MAHFSLSHCWETRAEAQAPRAVILGEVCLLWNHYGKGPSQHSFALGNTLGHSGNTQRSLPQTPRSVQSVLDRRGLTLYFPRSPVTRLDVKLSTSERKIAGFQAPGEFPPGISGVNSPAEFWCSCGSGTRRHAALVRLTTLPPTNPLALLQTASPAEMSLLATFKILIIILDEREK